MVRVPFLLCVILKLVHHHTVPFRYELTKKGSVRSWFGQKQTFFEDFYIKSLNWKRKRSNSNLQGKCEYQTTTNIAFSCKMVRVPCLLCVILKLVHHQTVPFRYGLPKEASGLDLDQKAFFEDFYIKSLNWKRKRSNSNFQVKCEY